MTVSLAFIRQLSITCGLCKHHTMLEVANLIAVVQTIRSQITPKLVSMSVVLLIQKCLAEKVFCVKI